jgi:hypothetical protein
MLEKPRHAELTGSRGLNGGLWRDCHEHDGLMRSQLAKFDEHSLIAHGMDINGRSRMYVVSHGLRNGWTAMFSASKAFRICDAIPTA